MQRPVLTDELRAAIREQHPRAVVLSDPEGELPDVVVRRPTAPEVRAFRRCAAEVLKPFLAAEKEREPTPEEVDALCASIVDELPKLQLFPDTPTADLLRVWPELEEPLGVALVDLYKVRQLPKASV